MLIWIKMQDKCCTMTYSICCWTWSFIDATAGVLCGIVSRKMWGMLEWLDTIKSVHMSWFCLEMKRDKISERFGNELQIKHPNLSQTKLCLLSFFQIPHIFHLCRAKLSSYSACSNILSLFSAKLWIQDGVAIPNHKYSCLWYSNSWRHQVLEGKRVCT